VKVIRFSPPAITRQAKLAVDQVFWFWGRPLRVAKIHGDDPAAPVILEELATDDVALAGQYSLWGLDGVRRALAGKLNSRQMKEEPPCLPAAKPKAHKSELSPSSAARGTKRPSPG